jgi:DNA repair photolyase
MAAKIGQIVCKSALSPCGLAGFEYSLNPYRGCEHGCLYCYSPSVLRERRPWGTFVDVKVNIPTVLSKELARKARGAVWLGSVCDAYQPVEERYMVTRGCLEVLLARDWPVSLLTKSALVRRDYPIMAGFSDFDLGFSIAYADEEARRVLEPGASPIQERIEAMAEAVRAGLAPWAFIAPIMPGFTDRPEELEGLISRIARAGVRRVGFDSFRSRPCIWPRMASLFEKDPQLARLYRSSLRDPDYNHGVARVIERECARNGLTMVA